MNNIYNHIEISLQTTTTNMPPSNTEKQRLLQNYQRNPKKNDLNLTKNLNKTCLLSLIISRLQIMLAVNDRLYTDVTIIS